MRAAIYHTDGSIHLEDVPDPVAGPGEIVIRTSACGICGSDLMRWYQDPRAPIVLGHEPVGIVDEAGEGVAFPVGQRVFAHHHVPCFRCERCRAGRHTLCERFRRTGLDPGGFAERIRVPVENVRADVLAIPDHVSDIAATLVEPAACVLRGQRRADVRPGVRVAVVGGGSMGLLEALVARALGVDDVVVVEPDCARRGLATGLGFRALEDGTPDGVREALGGELADAVFVCTHRHDAIGGALDLATPGGVVQLFAPTRPGDPVPIDLGRAFFREVSIASTYSAGPGDTRDALALIASGALEPGVIVSHRMPFRDIAGGFALARSGEALKVVVEFDGRAATAP